MQLGRNHSGDPSLFFDQTHPSPERPEPRSTLDPLSGICASGKFRWRRAARSLGETELALASGGVREGVSWRNGVWTGPWNVPFGGHAPPGSGSGGEGVPDALHGGDGPGGRRP